MKEMLGPSLFSRNQGHYSLTDLYQDHLSFFIPRCFVNLGTLFVRNLDAMRETLAGDSEGSTPLTNYSEIAGVFFVGRLHAYQRLFSVKVERDEICFLEIDLLYSHGV